MSRRAAAIEEFDDDTDFPLPSRPPLSAGSRAAILEEITASDDQDSSIEEEDDDDDDRGTVPGPASAFRSAPPSGSDAPPSNAITDITPYKHWSCIYPIYIDAKRPYGKGERRIAREKSVWWPLSKDIADATNRLGLGTIHEVNKVHPRDWENPGRVRVQWKKDGRLVNTAIGTKRQLLEAISLQIQRIKPDNIPRPPYAMSAQATTLTTPVVKAPTSNKGKQPAKSKAGTAATLQPQKHSSQRLPVPPEPHPPLASRLSAYSPALPTGVLIDTVKAGMNAQDQGAGLGPGMAGGAPQKGKRKVIRVRG
ncbi:signal recognition particle, SRP19 subunit [Pisolithus marmoratus]|nr:signal recognition particle, SRP19 subunit [Pisolithus marmoratus]